MPQKMLELGNTVMTPQKGEVSSRCTQYKDGLAGWLFGGRPPSLADEGITPTFIAQALRFARGVV